MLLLTALQGEAWILNFVGAGFVGFGLGGMVTYLQDSYLEVRLLSFTFETTMDSTLHYHPPQPFLISPAFRVP